MWDKQAEKCIIIVTIHIECFVQTNYMTAYRLEMKLYHALSCRNELVLDAYHAGHTSSESLVRKHNISLQYISSVSCRQITCQHIVSYRNQDEIVSYCMVSKRTRAGCISCGTNMYREFGAETLIHIVTIHIECFVQTNDMTAYRLNCVIPYRVENELVRDAYETRQIRIECLVRKHKYISLQYISSVSCRQMT
jgi:hypothetical protein